MSFYAGLSYEEAQWNKEKLATLEEASKAARVLANQIQELEVTKDANLSKIDSLAADNRRMRLHPPVCTITTDTVYSYGTSAGSRVVQYPVQSPLDDFTDGVGQDFARCDKVVESARLMSEYLKSLK
jgi:hypothetical protein